MVPAFVDLVVSSPHLLSYVRRLALTAETCALFATDIGVDHAHCVCMTESLSETCTTRRFIEMCTTKLPMLDILSANLFPSILHPLSEVQPAILSQFQTITTLGLAFMYAEVIKNLVLILASMPHVEHLILNFYTFLGFLQVGVEEPSPSQLGNAVDLCNTRKHPGLS
jgi:hypothetical protein